MSMSPAELEAAQKRMQEMLKREEQLAKERAKEKERAKNAGKCVPMSEEELEDAKKRIQELNDKELAMRIDAEERKKASSAKPFTPSSSASSAERKEYFDAEQAKQPSSSPHPCGEKKRSTEFCESQKENPKREDTSSDAFLAEELSKRFEDFLREAERKKKLEEQAEQDAKYVQEMFEGVDTRTHEDLINQFKNAHTNRAKLTAAELKNITAKLQEILNSDAVMGGPISSVLTDAHKHTRSLIRAGIPILLDVDTQLKLSQDTLTPEAVKKEVLEFLEGDKTAIAHSSKESINGTFDRIFNASAIDAEESHANAHHLLSRSWTLAKKLGPEYMGIIASCLSDNMKDKGGCIPGLIARLYAPYAKWIGLELGLKPESNRHATSPKP